MQKPKVGNIIILTKTLADKPLIKGNLGIVMGVNADSKGWGIRSLTVDFGVESIEISDLSFVDLYENVPKKEKSKKTPKDPIGKDVAAKL